MPFTLLGGISEIATATAAHGLLGYAGTNQGNLYSFVLATGAMTKLDSVGEKIVSISILFPTMYVSTSKGNVYTYAIDTAVDPYEVPLVTTAVGTVAIREFGSDRDKTTELTLTNFIVGALAGGAAALGVGNIVCAFPTGQHFEIVASLSALVLKCAGTAVATDTGLGSVIATGVVSVLSGTATFEDRLTGQTISTAAGGGAAVSALTAATAGIGTGIALNVAASVKNVFLNSAGTWNANNTGNLTASGKIVLKWTKM